MASPVVVLAARADDLAPALEQLVALAGAGVPVTVCTWRGELAAPVLTQRPLRQGLRRLLPDRYVARADAEPFAALRSELVAARAVVDFCPAGDALSEAAQESAPERVRRWPAAGADLAGLLAEAQCGTLAEIDRLIRAREHDSAAELIGSRGGSSPTMAACGAALLGAIRLTTGGEAPDDLDDLVGAALAAADREWGSGQAALATYALAAALRLLFHPDLHADVEDPPLARRPREFLRALHASSMFQAVSALPGAVRPPAAPAPGPEEPLRVVLLPGTYPRFAEPVAAALAEDPRIELRECALGSLDPRFKWLGFNTAALAWRVTRHPDGAGAGAIAGTPPSTAELFDDAGLIWADWGDRGAMWASVDAPPQARVVVRLHGMDLFAPWVQFIAWERVDDLVLVSEPYRHLAERILGGRLAGVRVRVIEHGVEPERFSRVETAPGAERLLGMVGWGKIVKDPLWALDVLEILRGEDPGWRLLLVGDELGGAAGHRAAAYEAEFRRRLDGPVGAAVELVPFTDDVAAQVARMGFILSASRRESFHLAVVEGALGGAVPVVRDWPVFAGGPGPAALFPPEWVVPDQAAAAARIGALSDPVARAQAARRARAEAVRRFNPDSFARQVRGVVAG